MEQTFQSVVASSLLRITAKDTQVAGSNLVITPKPGVITVTYPWAQ